ncbi:hypothetical protein JZ751_001853 [Albula glossodonta]|uniref:Electrogenic sodium bicarbonate cotransporter 1 n=1 Tax=Albula glossodonta TaxID=121402 RepID=A0A8T2PUU9_9TELE|nr:hypothetical protein JZ751_001853 [Albula glossodonta]
MITDSQIENGLLKADLKDKVMYTLLRKHRHQTKKSNLRSLADIGKTVSSASRLFSNPDNGSPTTAHRNLTSSSLNDISDKPEKDQLKNKFMKKLPRDAEASNVLVGEVDFLESPFVAFVRLQQAVMLGALTEVFHDIAYKAKDRQDLLAGIDEFLDEVIVLPPGEWDPTIRIEPPKSLPSSDKRKNMYAGGDNVQMNGDTPHDGGHGGGGHQVGDELKRTGRFCGGLILDIKRKVPFFASDFYDAIHIQSLSAILFIYLGTVTNAITFGGLLGDATENMQGVLESFLGTAVSGAVFCLLAGQPLTILSNNSSGLYSDSLDGTTAWMINNTDLPLNATWSSLTKKECLQYGGELVGNACKYVPDITLMSFILFFGTYTCSIKLISDFAIILAILIFCGVDALVGVDTPKLLVPSNPWWVYLASALPALLVTILLFMDQQITAVIVNRKEHKLKKGAGYHLDLFWVAVLLIVCSFMGLPWYVAATVISIAHIDSLKMETETSAPGEQPKFLGVREQRVTGVCVFLLTGLSVFMAPILKFIPMPVLYGVFLYMGVASLNGVQFMDRLKLLLMPAKHQPDLVYLRHVPLRKVHLFTFIQALCLALLWLLKSTVAAIIFPVMETSPHLSLNDTRRAERLHYFQANSLSSPERNPFKSVPQIRIDLEPEDNGFFWRSRGSETSL